MSDQKMYEPKFAVGDKVEIMIIPKKGPFKVLDVLMVGNKWLYMLTEAKPGRPASGEFEEHLEHAT